MYTTSRLSFASLAMLATTVVLSSATLTSSRATTVNEFTYTSCQSANDFQDASLGFVSITNSTFMSVGLCTSKCAENSEYAFAALYNTECFCGQHFTAINPGQDAECNTHCPGFALDTCGGSDWYSLYSKSASSSSSNTSSTVSTTASPGTTITSSTAVTGTSTPPAGNVSVTTTGTSSSSTASSTPSQVSASGAVAAVVGVERAGLLVSLVGLMVFL